MQSRYVFYLSKLQIQRNCKNINNMLLRYCIKSIENIYQLNIIIVIIIIIIDLVSDIRIRFCFNQIYI